MTAFAGNTRQRRLIGSLGPADQTRLRSALNQAQAEPVWLALHRAAQLPLTALITPADSAGDAAAQTRLHLRDPHDITMDPVALQTLFGLTPAEATVAMRLAAGWPPQQIAIQLGVQPNTVAAHLKRVLAKTGTTRQATLVALLRGCVACTETP